MSPQELQPALGFLSGVILGGLTPLLGLPLLILLWPRAGETIALPALSLIETVCGWLDRFARAALLVLLFGMLATVILRYVFGVSFTRLSESAMYAHALCFLAAAPAALLRDQHVRVDIFYGRLGRLGMAWTNFAGFHLLLMPTMVLLLLYAAPVVELAWRIGERSAETDGLPLVFALKTAIPIFAVSVLAAGLATAMRTALALRGRAPPPTAFPHPTEGTL
jgi:TRAP-type mannitol/chloroaromatic compound transport system permease small subunit